MRTEIIVKIGRGIEYESREVMINLIPESDLDREIIFFLANSETDSTSSKGFSFSEHVDSPLIPEAKLSLHRTSNNDRRVAHIFAEEEKRRRENRVELLRMGYDPDDECGECGH